VVVDVAVEEPDARVVQGHVADLHAAGEELRDVGAHSHHRRGLAVPVRRVEVDLGAEAHEVPAHALALLRAERGRRGARAGRPVAVDVAVDGVHEVALLELLVGGVDVRAVLGRGDVVVEVVALVLVHDVVEGDELAVDVERRAVRLRLAGGGDDHRPDQARVRVLHLVGVRVVHPHHRAAVVRAGPGARRHLPHVDVRVARRHGVVVLVGGAGAVVVRGALGALGVEDPVRVDAVRLGGVVAEHDLDRVADLGLEDRAEHPEVLPLGRPRLEPRERPVGVLAIERLLVGAADPLRAAADEHVLVVGERRARDQVAPLRRVVPADLVRGDVVGAQLARLRDRRGLRVGRVAGVVRPRGRHGERQRRDGGRDRRQRRAPDSTAHGGEPPGSSFPDGGHHGARRGGGHRT
jgi:hypothetical protein